MKLSAILLLFGITLSGVYLENAFAQNQNMNLIANVNEYPLIGYNDVWGYTAPNGDEYALLGTIEGVSINKRHRS